MDQPYSFWADWLDTFQTSSQAIQALWLVVASLALVAVVSSVARAVRDIAVAALIRREPGLPVHAVYRASDGRWLVHAGGAARELEAGALSEEGRGSPA